MKNLVNLHSECLLAQCFRHCMPLFVSSSGGTTTDLSHAKLDAYSQPIVSGYSHTEFVPHTDYTKKQSLSFNPIDPTARERAFLARDSMLTLSSSPTDYSDKFSVLLNINNSANKFCEKFTTLKNSKSHENS